MSIKNIQTGFSAVAVLLVIVVIGIVGFAGYSVYNNQKDKNIEEVKIDTQTVEAKDSSSAKDINSTKDLDEASKTLDANDPGTTNESDSSQLDSELNSL